jgi:UDP-glucose 4-epimerase
VPKALITGGAGFIGSHAVDRFLSAGYDVHVVDNLSSGKLENLPSAATLHQLDVRSPEAAALVRDTRFDVIAHFAAQIDVRKSVADPRYDADVNVNGTVNLLEALKSRPDASACRFVFVSTGGALYGDVAATASDELTAKNPDSPYGIAKLASEYYAAYYARVHRLETAVVRLGNVYGPRQDPHGEAGVVAIFCGRLGCRSAVTVFGDGKQTRDYVYVGDVARAVFAVAHEPLPKAGPLDARAFNIATGVGTSVLDLAKALGRVASGEPTITFAPERRGELLASVLDCNKARKLLKWEPATTLAEGLAETYAWFLARSTGLGK